MSNNFIYLNTAYIIGKGQHRFILPCTSLPIVLNKDSVIAACRHTVLQELNSSSSKSCKRSFADILSNIRRLLEIRLQHASIPKWIDFFNSIPSDNETTHASYINTLSILALEHGGKIQEAKTFSKLRLLTANDFIDPMTFNGGVFTSAEKISFLRTLNCYERISVAQGV